MNKSILGAATAAAVLALPVAAAQAHPGVYTVTAKIAPTGVTNPTEAQLTDQTQYAIANDGYTLGLVENNGLTGHGMLNYKKMPSAFRASMTAEQKRTYAPAHTDVQPHATCIGVASLDSGETILAWQQRSDNDPFFNYIPWQKTGAGLGDDPAKWIPVVKDKTGVDLSTVTDYAKACTDLGGTYYKADTSSNIATAQVADAVKPVQTQLDAANVQISALTAAKAAADQAYAALQAQIYALPKTPVRTLKLTLLSGRLPALVTGPANQKVTLKLTVTAAVKKQLKLKSTTLASKTVSLGSEGATQVKPKLAKTPKKAIKAKLVATLGTTKTTKTVTVTK